MAQLSIGATLPTELIQSIYTHLNLADFDAARHTCRIWMAASLQLQLLSTHLKRGGWWWLWTKALANPLLSEESSEAWLMSFYLASECSLAGSGAGNSLHGNTASNNPMIQSLSLDFTALKDNLSGHMRMSPSIRVICTTSQCGTYVVIAAGPKIFTHRIEGDSIYLVGQTSCERNVLSVSIDTKPGRLAVAALLEARIGIYIDYTGNVLSSEGSESYWETSGTLTNTTANAAVTDFMMTDGSGDPVTEVRNGDFDDVSSNAATLGDTDTLRRSVEIVKRRHRFAFSHSPRFRLRGVGQVPPLSRSSIRPDMFDIDKSTGRKTIIKTNPQIVYRNVCTSEDPPCSVAISLTRPCVAFGCKAGVELYWIDSCTGRHLIRWVNLSKPSDHLYFVPPRRSKDSSLRLRLINSAAYHRPADDIADPDASLTSQKSFWFTLRRPWHMSSASSSRQDVHCTDQCHAVPLSDGYHILFTDTQTGLVHLGTDTSRAQRVSRKFVLKPPKSLIQNERPLFPSVYAAGSDLSNGARIAVSYGDNIVLYSVPVDVLKYSTAEEEGTLLDVSVPFEEMECMKMLRHPASNAQAIRQTVKDSGRLPLAHFDELNMLWAHYLPSENGSEPESLEELWPLKLAGSHIGSLECLKALSIQGTMMDGIFVWAFSTSGMGKAWRLKDGESSTCSEKFADSEGLIHETVDSSRS